MSQYGIDYRNTVLIIAKPVGKARQESEALCAERRAAEERLVAMEPNSRAVLAELGALFGCSCATADGFRRGNVRRGNFRRGNVRRGNFRLGLGFMVYGLGPAPGG